jgi:uncharacterized protein
MDKLVEYVEIPVIDMNRAVAFYSRVLDVEIKKVEMDGHIYGSICKNGQDLGCLFKKDGYIPGLQGPLVTLSVDGRLDAALSHTEVEGGLIMQPKEQIGPHGFRAIIRDSEGNRVALHSN